MFTLIDCFLWDALHSSFHHWDSVCNPLLFLQPHPPWILYRFGKMNPLLPQPLLPSQIMMMPNMLHCHSDCLPRLKAIPCPYRKIRVLLLQLLSSSLLPMNLLPDCMVLIQQKCMRGKYLHILQKPFLGNQIPARWGILLRKQCCIFPFLPKKTGPW